MAKIDISSINNYRSYFLAIRTLILCTILHGFTHMYNVALIPLYPAIQHALNLPSQAWATFLVTAMLIAYFLPSYIVGLAAERYSKKSLLALGLVLNSFGFIFLAISRTFTEALVSVCIAGIGGSFYHPAATPILVQLMPHRAGKMLGIAGVGGNLGFLLGPFYAGWRAETVGWREAVAELGIAGIVVAILFLIFAVEPSEAEPRHLYSSAGFREGSLNMTNCKKVIYSIIVISLILSLRDFAGCAVSSGASIYFQYGHQLGSLYTGRLLSLIYLGGIVGNPVFGSLGDRNWQKWFSILLCGAGIMAVLISISSIKLLPVVLFLYGMFFMGNYPISESLLMKLAPSKVRGRIMGLYVTIAGPLGNLGHWWAGTHESALRSVGIGVISFFGYAGMLIIIALAAKIGFRYLEKITTSKLSEN